MTAILFGLGAFALSFGLPIWVNQVLGVLAGDQDGEVPVFLIGALAIGAGAGLIWAAI